MLSLSQTGSTDAAAGHGSPADDVHDVVMRLMPWVVSVLLHLGVAVLASFAVWSTLAQPDEEVIIPIANLSRTPGVKLQTQQVQRLQTQRAARRSIAAVSTSALAPSFAVPAPVIGLHAAPPAAASPFDGDADAGQQFATQFLGVEGGNAKQLAFVIDASGSVIAEFKFILDDLKNTINKLADQQSFTVVFYQGDDVIEVPPAQMKRADAATKRRVIEWIDKPGNIIPRGQTNPLKAIRLVLKYKPQVIFMLSDNITGRGRYEVDQLTLLSEIQAAVGTTKISTIQFMYPDPLASIPGRRGTLELIAEKTGGNYKFLDKGDLGIE